MYAPLRITEATVLALHALIYIDMKNDGPATTDEIAGFLNASRNHLSKVLQRLVKAGLVKSVRGPKGGFFIAKPPEQIPLREIYELFEGAVTGGNCLLTTPICGNHCVFGDLLSRMNALAGEFLRSTTLADALRTMRSES